MRGATVAARESQIVIVYFNPRSSCEERLNPFSCIILSIQFQSTLLMRGATRERRIEVAPFDISIHAPHARSDKAKGKRAARDKDDFNPRSSCEERRIAFAMT